ncbi:hypothetical protein B0E42_09085 [Pseudomonas sp. A25(2017)]|nr:hypothetical protein B0E42_09085 [Pseudomonas sp. A25(2017)]
MTKGRHFTQKPAFGEELMHHCCGQGLWEQSLLAKQTPRFLKDRIASIAGKPCSHNRLATR